MWCFPAAGLCGGRVSGEVPAFAWRDSRLPAGQEVGGSRPQQVTTFHPTRSSFRGGLKRGGKDEGARGNEEREQLDQWKQRGVDQ